MPDQQHATSPSGQGPESNNDVEITEPSAALVNRRSPVKKPSTSNPIDNDGSPAENDSGVRSSESAGKLSAAAAALVMTPLCLSVLLSALDITVITPAVPSIASSFQSESATGYVWVGSAYILANTASTPIWGSVADIWGRKPIILTALAIFLGGSLLCGLAPTMDSLITGRAIQGLGGSGMGTMVNVIICDTFSLRDRGLYLAVTSVVWAVGSSIGPIIGGLLTTRVNWRWCFWINLPVGVIVFVVLFLFLKVPTPNTPVLAGLKAIDWAGSMLIVGAALMTLLGLEFGGVTFPWSSSTVISLIVFGVFVGAVFIVNEWKFAVNPVIPLRLLSNKSSAAAYVVLACTFYILIGLSYYLPLYSQSTLGVDALTSSIYLLPIVVSSSLSAACTGVYIQRTGRYRPMMYLGQVMLALGAGLFINLGFEESLTKLFIFQVITGVGVGMNIEPPLISVQAATTVLDTAAVIGSMNFIRSIANTIAIVLGGVIFQNEMNTANTSLVDQIGWQLAGNFTGGHAAASVDFITTLPPDQQVVVRRTYFGALKAVWIMYVVVAGISLISMLFIRAHHLSIETETAVLGLDRDHRDNQQPVAVSVASAVELDRLQVNGSHSR